MWTHGNGRRPAELAHPRPRERRPGPSLPALVVLTIAALAIVATSQVPALRDRIVGEVVLSGGQTIERDLRIHVDPNAGRPRRGSIDLRFEAASGLDTGYANDVALSLIGASDAAGVFEPTNDIPVERCATGCDLTYRLRISADPGVLPASIVRYSAGVILEYDAIASPSERFLRLDLDGPATGPVVSLWVLVAGVIAFVAGIAAGPAVDRALRPSRRRWPALALALLPIALIVWVVGRWAIDLAGPGIDQLPLTPGLLLAVFDPWSTALLITLAWGVRRGIRRWPSDGGWLLGTAATATIGLGGLWLAWLLTLGAVIQPILLAVPFVVLGGIGGIVVGQAWRTDKRARHHRWTAGLAVLGHGVVIGGFGYLADEALVNPFRAMPSSLLLLVPAVLVALAFRRWFVGRNGWLVLFDLAIAAIGLFGGFLWWGLMRGVSTNRGLAIEDLAVVIAVVASVVALATAGRRITRQPAVRAPGEPMPPLAPQPFNVGSPAAAGGESPPTT